MGVIWLMVRKDLLRKLRAPLGILAVLAFPLVFSALLALTFGSGGSEMPKVELLIEDRDESTLSGFLVNAAGSEQMAEHFDVRQVGEEGQSLIEQDEASALFRIPEGFGDDLLNGRPVTFELVRNPAQGILPEIAEQSLTVLTDVLAAGAQVMREPLDDFGRFIETEDGPSLEQVLGTSEKIYDTIERSETLLFPPVITLSTSRLGEEEDEETSSGASTAFIFLLVLPGISVWALFITGDVGMRDILTEGAQGTLARQLAGPVTGWQLVVAKALFTAVLAATSLVILSAIGWAVSKTGVNLPAFALLSAGLILSVTGFAAVVYGLAANERQGTVIASVVMLVFAFLGGSFVQIDILPSAVRSVSPFTPFYWGTTGYQALIRDGAGPAEILPNTGILAGLGVVLLFAGSRLLGRKIRRGATA